MSAPDLYIEAGWVVERVGYHTCGTGRDGYYGAHEPGCGTIPVMPAWQWMTYVTQPPSVVVPTTERSACFVCGHASTAHPSDGPCAIFGCPCRQPQASVVVPTTEEKP